MAQCFHRFVSPHVRLEKEPLMKGNLSVFMLIIINVLLSVAGQSVTKLGVQKIGAFTAMPIEQFIFRSFLSPFVLGGLFLYLISAVIWFMVLSKAELSIAYPTLSMGYVLVLAIGYFFFGEPLTLAKILGVILICAGIYTIFR
jgi:multidrug transporter EmrE-like cation transporter